MNKEEYIQLHTLLAKLKYELEIELLTVTNNEYLSELRKQADAIDEVMKIFIIECEQRIVMVKMNKKEIRQFKSLLKQGILRHMNISLDYKFQQELLNIINDYEQLQNNWNELKKWCKENQYIGKTITFENEVTYTEILYKMQELEQGKDE